MTDIEQLQARLEALEAENTRLKDHSDGKLTLKVSAKGAVSVYGLQRFPVTLYPNQFEKLFEMAPQIREFIQDNSSKLVQR